MLIQEQLGIIQNLQTSPFYQTSLFGGTFLASSYSKSSSFLSWKFKAIKLTCPKKDSIIVKSRVLTRLV